MYIYIYIYATHFFIYIYIGKNESNMSDMSNMFDGLFICQRVSTFVFQSFLNAKVFYENYFCMRNNFDRQILIQFEVFIMAFWPFYVY